MIQNPPPPLLFPPASVFTFLHFSLWFPSVVSSASLRFLSESHFYINIPPGHFKSFAFFMCFLFSDCLFIPSPPVFLSPIIFLHLVLYLTSLSASVLTPRSPSFLPSSCLWGVLTLYLHYTVYTTFHLSLMSTDTTIDWRGSCVNSCYSRCRSVWSYTFNLRIHISDFL